MKVFLAEAILSNSEPALEGSDEQAETAEGTNKLHPVIFPGIEQPQKPEFKSQEEKYSFF